MSVSIIAGSIGLCELRRAAWLGAVMGCPIPWQVTRVYEEISHMTLQPPSPDVGIVGAVEDLQDLAELPVADHVARFNAVHESLTAALASIDEV